MTVRDVAELGRFYDSSLGLMARRVLRRRIRDLWPNVDGLTVLALGYATPFLRPMRPNAEQVLALMPMRQGVTFWPPEGPGQTALVDETNLPLPDLSVDRVLLAHGLDAPERLDGAVREAWRVLRGEGRILILAAASGGMWGRWGRQPFAETRRWQVTELEALLRENLFLPVAHRRALFFPPVNNRMVLALAPAWERLFARYLRVGAGVVLVEAKKQLYAVPHAAVPVETRVKGFAVGVPQGARAAARAAAPASGDR